MMDAPSERDMARLREKLLADLQDQATQRMRSMLVPGDQLFSDTLKVEETLEEASDPPLGQPGETVRLYMQVAFVASYAAEKDLAELASTVLNASVPEGFVPTQVPLDFQPLNAQRTDEQGKTRWSVRVSRQLQRKLDSARIIPLVQGRSPASAVKHLNQALSLANPAEIQLEPGWWPWLPLIPFNITVEIH